MTLEEAIKHFEDMTEGQEAFAKRLAKYDDMVIVCRECAEEYCQLAEWLKELKTYREERTNGR